MLDLSRVDKEKLDFTLRSAHTVQPWEISKDVSDIIPFAQVEPYYFLSDQEGPSDNQK
jgi:hypothetical protein